MKLFTLSVAAVAMVVALGASAAPLTKFKHGKMIPKTTGIELKAAKANRVVRSTQANPIWCPTHEVINAWVGEWYPIEERELSYNSCGLVINEIDINNEEGTYSKISTEYNDEGLMISKMETYSENGTDYLNNRKTIREYDSRVSDFITLNNEWLWIDEDWLLAGNNYTHTITRDEATGNITKVERAVYFNGIFDPTMRLTIEYTDGKASKITQTDLTYDYDTEEYTWMTSIVYSDIVWERTDGQIVSLDNVTSGNNRISSCHVQGFEYGDDYTATTVYNENGNISFTLLGTIDGYENTRVEGSTELLANGGTKVIETYILVG